MADTSPRSDSRLKQSLDTSVNRLLGQCVFVLALCLATITLPVPSAASDTHHRRSSEEWDSYTIVVDAGSSGSRVRVYGQAVRLQIHILPNIGQIYSFKQKPGLSEFGDNLPGIPAYLQPLIDGAKANIPEDKHAATPIFLMATAGMRLLPEDDANNIISAVNDVFSDEDINPFLYSRHNTRVLSGEEEGVFAWIAVNYLQGFFAENVPHEAPAGILELGGASTQVAFIPDGSILANKFPVKVAGQEYPVYVHSYLEYGQDVMVDRILEYLVREAPDNRTILNPCMLKGDVISKTINDLEYAFNGTGQPDVCREIIAVFIYKEGDDCAPKPCALGQIYQPSISDHQRFLAIGAFVHPLTTVQAIAPDGSFNLQQTLHNATVFCQRPYAEVVEETGRSGEFLSTECTMALYLYRLFTFAYGINEDSDDLTSLKDIQGQPLEWPLGAVIYETEKSICADDPRADSVKSLSPTYPSLSLSCLLSVIIVLIRLTCVW